MRSFILSVGVLTLAAVGIGAQAVPKEYAEMAAAMQAAQARAMRPGDDALPCAALEKELASNRCRASSANQGRARQQHGHDRVASTS
jgi:hypothetical protein